MRMFLVYIYRIFWSPPPLLAEVQKKTLKTAISGGGRNQEKKTQRRDWVRRNQKPQTQEDWRATDWQNLPKLGTAAPGRGPAFPGKLTIGTHAGPSH